MWFFLTFLSATFTQYSKNLWICFVFFFCNCFHFKHFSVLFECYLPAFCFCYICIIYASYFASSIFFLLFRNTILCTFGDFYPFLVMFPFFFLATNDNFLVWCCCNIYAACVDLLFLVLLLLLPIESEQIFVKSNTFEFWSHRI